MRADAAPALWARDRGMALAGLLCGVDEVGSGPLAGSVVAACVILDLEAPPIPGVNDSKKLTPAKREALAPLIMQQAVAYALGEADAGEIDQLNIMQATFLAMRRALEALLPAPALVLVDGNRKIPGIAFRQETLVGGDGLSASIAAASILAKVARDRAMTEAAELYPEYGFEAHKGYGTGRHLDALRKHGPSPLHRLTFCGNILARNDLLA